MSAPHIVDGLDSIIVMRAVGRETALLDCTGLSPLASARWARGVGSGGIGAAIRKRLEELERDDG